MEKRTWDYRLLAPLFGELLQTVLTLAKSPMPGVNKPGMTRTLEPGGPTRPAAPGNPVAPCGHGGVEKPLSTSGSQQGGEHGRCGEYVSEVGSQGSGATKQVDS